MCEHNRNDQAYCAYCIVTEIRLYANVLESTHQHLYGTSSAVAQELYKILDKNNV